MKRLLTLIIACILSFYSIAQEVEATTEQFYVNFKSTAPVEVEWVYPTLSDTLVVGNDIVVRIGMKSKSEIMKMSLLVNSLLVSTDDTSKEFISKEHPDYDVYVERKVKLRVGDNVLKFTAENANGQKDMKESTIFLAPKAVMIPIEVSWLYPLPTDTIVNEQNILVSVGIISEGEIKKMSLLLNGLPVSTEVRGENLVRKPHSDYDVYIEQSVKLNEGGNVLKFVAQDINGQSSIIERTIIMISKDDLAIVNRKDYALLFAIDDYDEWGNLSNPVSDARAIATELKDNYGFDVELVENFQQRDVLVKIREYAKKSYGDFDQLFIFFAGHGQFDELLGQGYIVSKNSRVIDEAKISYISHSVLRNAIDNIPNQHILLAMDVCYGGTFDPLIARSGSRGQGDLYTEIGLNEYISRKLKFKTRKYITSGGKQYVPDGRPGMHSPFASKILEGLRSYGGRDNIITLAELTGWLERINPEPRTGGFGTNEPGSDFVFVVKEK